jgi:putative spermidine/putrescine transport system substrate-binding protein
LSALVRAARREGQLYLASPSSALPGYDSLIAGFEKKFGISVELVGNDGDYYELTKAEVDAFDISLDTAASHTYEFAPYLVFYWSEIPSALKNSKAYWYQDCGTVMGIGYDASRVRPVGAINELLLPEYRASVELDGDPTSTAWALNAVMMASLANGGSPDDIGPGVDFIEHLATSGNLSQSLNRNPPVVLQWTHALPSTYTTFLPPKTVQAYDLQAVNRKAPHPAAARLWEEFLFSDAGQNLCLHDGAWPARLEKMRSDGVLDLAGSAALGPAPAGAVTLTEEQTNKARWYLSSHWFTNGPVNGADADHP